ncbi:hypothetical protein [Treponema sp.]|uniref:hypothetical protein n=1 Tax=Treponema sp. TaxID=166 RepID=UPI00388EB53D
MAEIKKTENVKNKSGLMGKAMEISEENKGKTGKGLLKHITEKNGARTMTKVIVEKNGVFVIQPGIETSEIKQDPALKALIDSVLK